MTKRHFYLSGVLPICIAAIIWGVTVTTRRFLSPDLGALTITLFYTFCGMVSSMLLSRLSPFFFLKIDRKLWPIFILSSIFGGIFGTGSIILSLSYAPVAMIAILERTQPIFTIILAHFMLKEHLTKSQILLILLAIAFTILFAVKFNDLSMNYSTQDLLTGGAIIIFGAASSALASIFSRKIALTNVASAKQAAFRNLITVTILLPLVLLHDSSDLFKMTAHDAGIIACTGFFGSSIAYICYYKGMKVISASIANVLEFISPIIAIALGCFVFGESIGLLQIGAAIGMSLCLILLTHIEALKHHPITPAASQP